MKRYTTTTNSGTAKISASPATQLDTTNPWAKTDKRNDMPAPPPVWTRYIDSRLKQFCTR